MRNWFLHTRRGRAAIVLPVLGLFAGALVWRAPDLDAVGDAFTEVRWRWVAAAIGMNLLSVAVRAGAWHVVVNQALPPPSPRHRHVLSAFCVGLLGNAVLPGRVGEVARVAVLARHVPHGRTTWASILGSTFAHRVFDAIPIAGLVIYVVATARIPGWALPGVEIVLGIAIGLFVAGVLLAFHLRRRGPLPPDGAGRVRRLWHMSLAGLSVLHSPGPAVAAATCQLLGWTAQILAVALAFRAFQIDAPMAAAGLVLLVVNVALAFPLWPGSVGLFQAAVALALVPYGIARLHGFAFGVGLQAIEASVGIGLGFAFLAREGISFAALKRIPRVTDEEAEDEPEPDAGGAEKERAISPRPAATGTRPPGVAPAAVGEGHEGPLLPR